MTAWPKDVKEFTVSVIRNKDRRTSYSYISKPTLQTLGNPDNLKFIIRNGYVEVKGSDYSGDQKFLQNNSAFLLKNLIKSRLNLAVR